STSANCIACSSSALKVGGTGSVTATSKPWVAGSFSAFGATARRMALSSCRIARSSSSLIEVLFQHAADATLRVALDRLHDRLRPFRGLGDSLCHRRVELALLDLLRDRFHGPSHQLVEGFGDGGRRGVHRLDLPGTRSLTTPITRLTF